MSAIREANIGAKKVAIGVIVAELSTSDELRKAGADFIIEKFDNATLSYLEKIV